MPRNEYAAVTSIQQLPQVQRRTLLEVWSLSTGVTRACDGYNFVVAAGNTFSPMGGFGGIDGKIQEDSDPFPRAVKLWLCAITSAQIADMLSESLFDKPVRIFEVYLTDSFTAVSTPLRQFTGNINIVDYKRLDPERGNHFTIEAESRLFRKPRAQYFNRATLWTYYAQSGDQFFDMVSQIPFVKANWGLAFNIDYGPGGGHSGGGRNRDRGTADPV